MPSSCFNNAANPTRLFCLVSLLTWLITACAPAVEYWIPPSSRDLTTTSQTAQIANLVPHQSIAALAALSLPEPAVLEAQLDASTEEVPTQVALTVEPEPTQVPITPTPTLEAEIEAPALPTASPEYETIGFPVQASPTPVPEAVTGDSTLILYYAQAADTVPVVAVRFGVDPGEIQSPEPVPEYAYLTPGQLLIIPQRLPQTTSSERLIPDSEVVFSPSAAGFDTTSFIQGTGSKLATRQDWLKSTGAIPATEVIQRVAIENSINPRLLLSLLEYQTGWVFGESEDQEKLDYPIGYKHLGKKGLYNQLMWAVDQLSTGYYAYREGRLTEIRFPDGLKARLAPDLNAGTAALQYFFAQLYPEQEWLEALDSETGFPALHAQIFGDPWQRSLLVEPLFPAGLEQPPLVLPFERNQTWSYTGGPHGAWDSDGAYAALDFAPGGSGPGCKKTNAWAVASAPGLVVRSERNVVVLDLDGDGYEQTGWVLTYLHIASQHAIPAGTWVDVGDILGHPSCEGGFSTGTHVHIARKFNGEWIPASGPLPFNLGGWTAQSGGTAYKGTLTRDGSILTACVCSSAQTFITRTEIDP